MRRSPAPRSIGVAWPTSVACSGWSARARVAAEKVRIVFEHAHDAGHTATIHLHPRDTGGAILSLDEVVNQDDEVVMSVKGWSLYRARSQ